MLREMLRNHVASDKMAAERAYWSKQVPQDPPALPVRRGFFKGGKLFKHTNMVSRSLTEEKTATLLGDVHKVFDTRINDA